MVDSTRKQAGVVEGETAAEAGDAQVASPKKAAAATAAAAKSGKAKAESTFTVISDHRFSVIRADGRHVVIEKGMNDVPDELRKHPAWGWHKCKVAE